jgi:hypothetical protein
VGGGRDGAYAAAAEESERQRRVQSPRPQVFRGPAADDDSSSSSSSDDDASVARRANSSQLQQSKVNKDNSVDTRSFPTTEISSATPFFTLDGSR